MEIPNKFIDKTAATVENNIKSGSTNGFLASIREGRIRMFPLTVNQRTAVDINLERRKYKRFEYEAVISHDILSKKTVYSGKIYNLSKGGLYFESDQIIYPGEQVCLEIVSHADPADNNVHLFYGVQITWHCQLKNSYLGHGFGARFVSPDHSLVKNMDVTRFEKSAPPEKNLKNEKDPRQYIRRPYNKRLLFTYNQRAYKGLVTDLSHGGAFIETGNRFALGRPIDMVIPGSKIRDDATLKGWVIRLAPNGVGVRFDKRSGRERRCDLDRRTGRDRRRMTRAQKRKLRAF